MRWPEQFEKLQLWKYFLSFMIDWQQWVNAKIPNVAQSCRFSGGEDSAGWPLWDSHSQFTFSVPSNVSPKCVRAAVHYNNYRAHWFSRIQTKSLSTHQGIKHGSNYCTLSLAVGLVLLGGVHTILLIPPSSNLFGFHCTERVCKLHQ